MQRVPSSASYTSSWGYSRAVRIGNRILVSGTSATRDDGTVHAPGDPYEQTLFILKIIGAALEKLEAGFKNVVLTRVFITDPEIWREVGRAHLETFGEILPVSSCIAGIKLMQPGLLVEIEAEAIAS